MMRAMSALEFPRIHLALVQELAARLVDSRKPGTETESLARDLLVGFFNICVRCGLDRLLVELAPDTPLDITDTATLADEPRLHAALLKQLGMVELDAGGPRNAKPGQLVDCLTAALGLTLTDEADRSIALADSVRAEITAALASVINSELAVPQIRETIIAEGRKRCDAHYQAAFDKIAAQLDERGMRLVKQPKLPLDAVHAVHQVLYDTRNALIDRVARTAIDRAKPILARASAEAAERIDQPITLRITPREAAIIRASDPRVPKVPAAIVTSLLDSLSELAHLVWRVPEKVPRAYAPSQTFAVGDVIDHAKFGRGEVVAISGSRIDVEFADGKHTLVHAPSK